MMNRRKFVQGAAMVSAAAGARTMLGETQVPFIDSHVHVWKHDAKFPFAAGAKVPPQDMSAENLLALMRANNVARTVLIQVIHYRWDNSYLADVLRRYPKEFRGVCRVNPEDPKAPDTLSQLTEQGFHGVRLSPAATAQGDWIRGPLMKPLWKRCAELRVPMTLLIPVTRLPDIVPLLDSNSELTVVIDHMADSPLDQPKLLENLLALARYPKVFVKATHLWSLSHQAYPYHDAQEQVKRLYDRFGPDRLMAGTDWPIAMETSTYAQRVALYREQLSYLSARDREAMTYRTVQRVWDFGV